MRTPTASFRWAASPAASSSGCGSPRRSSRIRRCSWPTSRSCRSTSSSQRTVVDLLDRRRRESGTPVVFVTHDVNPILRVADTVLYLAPGRWAIGPPAEVLTTETLSRLYDTPVDVLRVRGRVVVVGTPDDDGIHHHDHASAGSH